MNMFLFWFQKFGCGGRMIFGPDSRSLYLTSFLIGCLAFAFCAKMIVVFKDEDPHFDYPVLFVGLFLTLLVSNIVFTGTVWGFWILFCK